MRKIRYTLSSFAPFYLSETCRTNNLLDNSGLSSWITYDKTGLKLAHEYYRNGIRYDKR